MVVCVCVPAILVVQVEHLLGVCMSGLKLLNEMTFDLDNWIGMCM